MPDSSHLAEIDNETFAAAVARWSTDPCLGAMFAGPSPSLIVLDTQARTIVQACGSAAELRFAIADRQGRLNPALKLGEQLRGVLQNPNGWRLTRLRLDARGLARPTACRVAQAEIVPGRSVLVIAPVDMLPALRPADTWYGEEPAPQAAAAPSPTHTEPAIPADPSARFVWRSNADGLVTHVSGTDADVVASLSGRTWEDLSSSGIVVGEAVLDALSDRRTFRGLPIIVRPPQSGDEVELELSGAPAARPHQNFAGFGGFGLIRKRSARRRLAPAKPAPASEPASMIERAPETPPRHETIPAIPSQTAPAGTFASSWSSTVSSVSLPIFGERLGGKVIEPVRSAEPPAEADAGREPDASVTAPTDAALSVNENAAFREIARALGARFAGDDEETAPSREPQGTAEPEPRGEVTPFRSPSSTQSNAAAIEAAIVSALSRLPAGVLVHRDGAVLFANQRILDLAGCRTPETLRAVAHALLRTNLSGEKQVGPADQDETVSFSTPQGTMARLLVERTRIDWQGEPANLLLARPATRVNPLAEKISQSVVQARNPTQATDQLTLLDHIEDGVTTIDESGRILSMNRSAKTLLSGAERDLVGGFLDEFFVQDDGKLIAATLREAAEAGRSTPRDLRLRHRPQANLKLRIVRLNTTGGANFCAMLREAAADQRSASDPQQKPTRGKQNPAVDFISKVEQEVRTPLDGILASVDVMLAEQFGPLGSERYREYLREIQNSGEHVLGVVDDLMNLARIEAGDANLSFTEVPLNAVISACIAQLQPQAARDRILLRTSLSPELKTLFADEPAIRQATLKVIENALRLTGAGGQVIVSTTVAERGEIAIRVRDTGSGMTTEELDSALRPFDRKAALGAGGKNQPGLALSLTKALVEANRGLFRITSRKNEGTLVEMVFPVAQAMSA